MVFDIPEGDKAAFTRIESYHQAHYYEKLTECVACLFHQNFTKMETKVWCELLSHLYSLNESFLDDIVNKMQEKEETEQEKSAIGSTAHWIGKAASFAQNILPFNMGHLSFTAPLFESIKLVSQVTEVVFTFNIQQSITRFLVNQFKIDSRQGHTQAELEVSKSLEANHSLSEKIIDESHALSRNLLKLFMFREMLLQGKLTNDMKEQAVRDSFLNQAGLEKAKKDKVAAIIEVYFIRELNSLFEQSFKGLFEFQQQLIEEEQNEFDRWLGELFESNDSRQLFSRQIQLQFLQATRDFFVQKQNERSVLGKHPYLYSIAIGLTVALLTISVISLVGAALSTLPLLSSALTALAFGFTASILIITKLHRVYYARSPQQRKQLQVDINILNQNITHIQQTIENSKKTAKKELDWLEQFQTINATFFTHKHVLFGFHESWVREYAARYRHAKVISNDLKEKIVKLIDQSTIQSQKLIRIFQKEKLRLDTWNAYLHDTKAFIEHPANQKAIDAFELRLKIREQLLHLVSRLTYIPPQLSAFYKETLKGQETDLAYIQHFYQSRKNPYQQLCRSAQRLYIERENSFPERKRFYGDSDYRQLLKLPNLATLPHIKPYEISTYLRNSLHFLLLLNNPIKPGLGLDPLVQPFMPSDEYFLYRMMWFRQLAKLYFSDSGPDDQSNRLFIESFVERYFNVSAKEIFDDILNQSYYLPNDSVHPSIEVNHHTYATEQLDYIFQSLTLDIACHTSPLTPHHILNCYRQDYQEATERKEPIKLIALNLSRADLSLQQSVTFENYVIRLINNTQGFIEYLNHNGMPKSYIDCYQFNVIEQLITLQLDIIIRANQSGKSSQAYSLVNLWNHIDSYLSMQPYKITPNSGLYRLFDLFRKSPKAIYPFTLPTEQMNKYKDSIKKCLLSGPPKTSISSFWASTIASDSPESDAIAIKNL